MRNPYKEDYFDPFLREILKEEIPVCAINQDEDQAEEPVEPTTEEKLAACFTVENLLEQAALNYHNNEAFLQSLKVLLLSTINEATGGDPNINNLLKAKLKLFNQNVKHLQEMEKKKHSTPKFLHLILHPEPKKLLGRRHRLSNGKSGAAVGAVLLRAQQKGYLSKVPTQAEFESEFTLNGGWNAIHNYMNDNNQKALAKANKIIIFEGE